MKKFFLYVFGLKLINFTTDIFTNYTSAHYVELSITKSVPTVSSTFWLLSTIVPKPRDYLTDIMLCESLKVANEEA